MSTTQNAERTGVLVSNPLPLSAIATPATIATRGQTYGKDVTGTIELHYLDSAGNEVQLTSGGSPAGGGISQGGDAFGVTMQIGTTDAQDFEFLTNNTPRASITSGGTMYVPTGGVNNAGIRGYGAGQNSGLRIDVGVYIIVTGSQRYTFAANQLTSTQTIQAPLFQAINSAGSPAGPVFRTQSGNNHCGFWREGGDWVGGGTTVVGNIPSTLRLFARWGGARIKKEATTVTGATPALEVDATTASHTAQESQIIDYHIKLNRTVTFLSGVALQQACLIEAPVYDAVSAGTVIDDCATLAISGAPTAGSGNLTFTRTPYTLWLKGGTLRVDIPSPALGGGAAATLGTIGGSGPTVAAQDEWLEVNVDGNTRFAPLWA